MEMLSLESLIEKYNIAAPRYTSYPTVPFWDIEKWSENAWLDTIRRMYKEDKSKGVGVYVHLPYCESLCTYCGCNTRITKNHTVEEPYIDSLLKEWQMYKDAIGKPELQINDLHLGGGTPTFFASENLSKLIKGLLGGKEPMSGSTFSFEAHPANTTEEHLQTLYDLGFRRLSLGIQDFDPKVQFIINRKQSEEDVIRVMEQARRIGYESINFDLIYGLPLQTMSSVSRTISSSLAMKPDRISFYSYAHVPWMKPAQRRFTEADLPAGQTKLDLYRLGKKMIQEAGYEDVGMDHFSTTDDELYQATVSGKLHRNFMGYTDKHVPLLIGLGVSSIGDSWYGFAQNVKTVEAYHKLIGENKLPLLKGHVLNDEDLLIRRQILDVMCQGNTTFPGNTIEDSNYPAKKIWDRLQPLVEDGLIEVKKDLNQGFDLFVTKTGKSFLRNICMAFDERLMGSQVETSNKFSQAV